MSGFDSYSSYVASDLFWLDKMPVDWTVKRIKEVVLELDQGWSPNAASWPADPNEYGVLKLSAISNGVGTGQRKLINCSSRISFGYSF